MIAAVDLDGQEGRGGGRRLDGRQRGALEGLDRPVAAEVTAMAAAEPKIACRSLWKLFGPGRGGLPRPPPAPPGAGRARRRRPRPGGDRRQPRGPPRRDLRHHGPLGLGQVDAGPLPLAADRAHRRRGPLRRPGPAPRLRPRADRDPPPPHGHGVPELRAAAAPLGAAATSPSRSRCRASPRGRARGARPRDDRARRAQGPRGEPAARALRRPAAARRHRPLAGGRPRGLVPRRAVLGARPADPPRDAERVPAAAGARCRRPSSSSPTTSTRRSASPTASPSCATAASCSPAPPRS